jgi:hypothetical protein
MASNSFNAFKVLSPAFKEAYAPKKLKQPKLANPTPNINKKPKIVMPGTGSGGY